MTKLANCMVMGQESPHVASSILLRFIEWTKPIGCGSKFCVFRMLIQSRSWKEALSEHGS